MEKFTRAEGTAIFQLPGNMLGRCVLLVGDAMLVHSVPGPVDRIVPEAPEKSTFPVLLIFGALAALGSRWPSLIVTWD
jgi:bifunctional ADP-heptose synthase (sugar kinase/adenylyltransferase)